LNPVEVAEYAIVNRLVEEPAFKWWVQHVICCSRNWIFSKVKSHYWKTANKFGICLLKTVEEASEIDGVTNMDFWREAVNKEMAKVKIAWATHDGHREGKVPQFIVFQEIGCHIVFDIKMGFTWKARFVASGHTTSAPSLMTYLSVVSRDSVRLAFLIAALNDIDKMSCDLKKCLPERAL
jgi:hypothetical protein